jgi:hypothetical protein
VAKLDKLTKLSSSTRFEELCDEFQESFLLNPMPSLIQLPAGFQVYKWAGTSRIDKASGHRVRNTIFGKTGVSTPYWSPWAAMPKHRAPGFKEIRTRYRNLNGGVGRFQEMARARLAVTNEFSEMNSIVKAELKTPAWAFAGLCRHQRVNEKEPDVVFIGGDFQLVIPGLTADNIFAL